MLKNIRIDSYPRALAHVDCDAFFASVEQALHPELKGLPIITGAERGIVSAASYEAKRLGIQRGVSLSDVKKIAPNCLLIPSDYETYSLYSEKLFSILRRFTPDIETYSIDEAFIDLTGLRRLYRCSYIDIAKQIQKDVHDQLDIGVSIGVSLSKSLCKIASNYQKPKGLVAIPGRHIHLYLAQTPIESIWGFGKNITAFLSKKEIYNAYQYIQQPQPLVQKWLGKIGSELWQELRGDSIYPIQRNPKTTYASICKSKTFAPALTDPQKIYARLLRNLESACIKCRRYKLGAKTLTIFLKKQNFETKGFEVALSRPENSPLLLTKYLKLAFNKAHEKGRSYRATGVVLGKLEEIKRIQFNLFENPLSMISKRNVYSTIDKISTRFGKHSVFLGPGLHFKSQFSGLRSRKTERKMTLLKGENHRQRLGLPLLKYKGI